MVLDIEMMGASVRRLFLGSFLLDLESLGDYQFTTSRYIALDCLSLRGLPSLSPSAQANSMFVTARS